VRQLQDTPGSVANQLWVLQVVGSNPAAPTKNQLNNQFKNRVFLSGLKGVSERWSAVSTATEPPRRMAVIP
jgi:hypothetical protein